MRFFQKLVISSLVIFGGNVQAQTSKQLIRYDYKEGEVKNLCTAAMGKAKVRLDALAQIPAEKRTFKNTVLSFEEITTDLSDEATPLTFMGYVSTNPKISAEGSDCEQRLGQFTVTIFTRKDLYQAIENQKSEDAGEARLLHETKKAFEHNGLKLSDEKLAQVKDLKQKLSAIESQFETNLNGDNTSVKFTAAELDGVSADFLSRLKKSANQNYIVTTKSTDFEQVMENAKTAETRRQMLFAYNNRAAEKNTKLLEDAILLREQIAKIMGYKNWADYRMDDRMAKDPKTVMNFLSGLKDKLIARAHSDLATLLAYKKKLDPKAKELNAWDTAYLSYQLKKEKYNLDDDKIREYFPADVVIKGLFDVYSKLLGVKYIEVIDAETWAPDVKLYKIEDGKSHQLVGYFYTDFVPRPGKYGHAAAFPLFSARQTPQGYAHPIAAIVANFNPPANGKPSLLNHDEVETVFHEFGHIMHQTLTKAPYASLSGSSVAQDFVEAPSQMLENWVWSEEIVSKLSGHYLDHSKKLPPKLLKQMLAARDFNQGYFYIRQLMFALLDMSYHTASGPVDSAKVYDDLYRDLLGVEPLAGTHFPASFGHLMGGYDAGYYGYLWSEVYAEDMFTKFKKEGLLSPVAGGEYRRDILERGNMVEAIELIRKFLGREPNSKAFFKRLHI